MGDNQIGYMRNAVHRTENGDWRFATTSHFNVLDNNPVTTSKALVFSQFSPYPLLKAHYRTIKKSIDNEIEAELSDQHYSVSIRRGLEESKKQYQWNFSLTDYLSIELWLNLESPKISDRKVGKTLDLEKLRVINRAYKIVELNDRGYVIENDSPISSTKIQLDKNYQPSELTMAGIFEISASDRKRATSLSKIASKDNLIIPLDQRIINPTGLSSLRLRIQPSDERDAEIVKNISATLSGFKGSSNSSDEENSYLGETIRYPINHPRILDLKTNPHEIASLEDISRLVSYTNSLLRYRENRAVGSVLKSLELGYGECTDFTDLFTTLARSHSIPARPVYGIAYKNDRQPGFMFHSWNQIYLEGQWISVDATWNQSPADATHISLSDDQYSTLLVLSTTKTVQLMVESTSYD